jgi:hypothetical protein
MPLISTATMDEESEGKILKINAFEAFLSIPCE